MQRSLCALAPPDFPPCSHSCELVPSFHRITAKSLPFSVRCPYLRFCALHSFLYPNDPANGRRCCGRWSTAASPSDRTRRSSPFTSTTTFSACSPHPPFWLAPSQGPKLNRGPSGLTLSILHPLSTPPWTFCNVHLRSRYKFNTVLRDG
jgi:hypothetical protein